MSPIIAFLKRAAKKFLEYCPAFVEVTAYRWAARIRGQPPRDHRLDCFGGSVQILSGPFRGMRYLDYAHGSQILPKLLGTYEMELWPAVNRLTASHCDLIIDIGAAEGYYAVGLARAMPKARVVAFEMSKAARYHLRRLARLNQVRNRLKILGKCELSNLRDVLATAHSPIILCDCEGAEDILLDPGKAPELLKATILVELHPFFSEGITERIRDRFRKSHIVEQFNTRNRTEQDLPADSPLRGNEALSAMDEMRPEEMSWFLLTPITSAP